MIIRTTRLVALAIGALGWHTAQAAKPLITGSGQAIPRMDQVARIMTEKYAALDAAYHANMATIDGATDRVASAAVWSVAGIALATFGYLLARRWKLQRQSWITALLLPVPLVAGIVLMITSMNTATNTFNQRLGIRDQIDEAYRPFLTAACTSLAQSVTDGDVATFSPSGWQAAEDCGPWLVAASH